MKLAMLFLSMQHKIIYVVLALHSRCIVAIKKVTAVEYLLRYLEKDRLELSNIWSGVASSPL